MRWPPSALRPSGSTTTSTSQPPRPYNPALHVEREVLLTRPYITCRQLIEFISRYRDHELTSRERTEFDRHLAVCPSCVTYLKTYEQTVLLAKASAEDPVPTEVPEPLLRAILEARRKPEV